MNSHDLREGDIIFLKGRGPTTLRRVVRRPGRTPICNLTIKGLHTYAVGELQILVHNTSGTPGGNPAPRTFPPNSVTPSEAAEIQAIANKYQTTIDVVGSRAAGNGRNVGTNLPKGKGPNARSDIDFRIDGAHPQADALIADLKKVGNGVGTAAKKYSNNPAIPGGRETNPPFIRFGPES